MRTYTFECYEDDNGCGCIFEIEEHPDKISSAHPKCPTCKKSKPVKRNFSIDCSNVQFKDNAPRTVGALADKNTERKSDDELNHIYRETNKYKYQKTGGIKELPKGMSRTLRDQDGQRIISTKQRQRDPKRKPRK